MHLCRQSPYILPGIVRFLSFSAYAVWRLFELLASRKKIKQPGVNVNNICVSTASKRMALVKLKFYKFWRRTPMLALLELSRTALWTTMHSRSTAQEVKAVISYVCKCVGKRWLFRCSPRANHNAILHFPYIMLKFSICDVEHKNDKNVTMFSRCHNTYSGRDAV